MRIFTFLAFVTFTVALSVPTAGVAAPSCTAQVDQGSTRAGDLLLSVAGTPERAIGVGIRFVGGNGTPLVLQRSGTAWSPIRVPTQPGARMIQLQDVTATGSRFWAVGAFRNDRPQAGWIGGGTWHWTHPIDPGEGEDEFLGVAVAPDGTVWAVGKHQVGHDDQPLIESFDGAAWSVVDLPTVRGSVVLNDVAVTADGSVQAVGWRVLHGGVTEPYGAHLTHGRWRSETPAGAGLLSGIAILPDATPIAVGWRPTDDGDQILTMRFDTSWTPLANATGDPGRLTSVATGGSTVAVGTRFVDGVPAPIAVRRQEGWRPIELTGEAAPETGGDQLLGITGEPGSFLAVGIRDGTDAFGSLIVAGACLG